MFLMWLLNVYVLVSVFEFFKCFGRLVIFILLMFPLIVFLLLEVIVT